MTVGKPDISLAVARAGAIRLIPTDLMLLQTNSYLVPRDRRAEHTRLMRRFAACFERLGSDFAVYEQIGSGFSPNDSQASSTRFVQMMRFRDAEHHQQVQQAEQADDVARRLISDFCRLIDLDSQQRQGLYAGGFYSGQLEPTPRSAQRSLTHAPPHPAEGDDSELEELDSIEEEMDETTRS